MQAGCATLLALNKWDLAPRTRTTSTTSARRVNRKLRLRPQGADRSARKTGRNVDARARRGDRRSATAPRPRSRRRSSTASSARSSQARQPPAKQGHRLKLLYMAQIETRPPRFAIQVNSRNRVTRDYAYFVENRLRARYGLDGVPLIIDFVERKQRRRGAERERALRRAGGGPARSARRGCRSLGDRVGRPGRRARASSGGGSGRGDRRRRGCALVPGRRAGRVHLSHRPRAAAPRAARLAARRPRCPSWPPASRATSQPTSACGCGDATLRRRPRQGRCRLAARRTRAAGAADAAARRRRAAARGSTRQRRGLRRARGPRSVGKPARHRRARERRRRRRRASRRARRRSSAVAACYARGGARRCRPTRVLDAWASARGDAPPAAPARRAARALAGLVDQPRAARRRRRAQRPSGAGAGS